jgi:putative ABC transport system substrate-binding protein
MTTRRQVLMVGALSALITRNLSAQARTTRLGILAVLPREKSLLVPLLTKALSDLGYPEGAAMQIEYRFSRDIRDYPRMIGELVGRGSQLIFALGTEPAARALRDARTQVPGIFIALDFDPLETGLVETLGRPGGNMTGVYVPSAALAAKRIEIAGEILAGASRFLVFADRESGSQLERLTKAAAAQGVQLTVVQLGTVPPPYDFAAGFEAGRAAKVEAVLALVSTGFALSRAQFSEYLVRQRLPAFSPAYMADLPGVLAAYSIDTAKLMQRAAEMGVRILKGTKPSAIPIEQLNEYELIVNMRTAKALGIKIPYSVMVRATKVIE